MPIRRPLPRLQIYSRTRDGFTLVGVRGWGGGLWSCVLTERCPHSAAPEHATLPPTPTHHAQVETREEMPSLREVSLEVLPRAAAKAAKAARG